MATGASDDARFGPLLGRSLAMRELFSLPAKAAPTEATVLIEGESGTGKELVAQALHDRSARSCRSADCGAMASSSRRRRFSI